MPLIQSPSKKAFKKNVETEMNANPEKAKRSKNLAIAYAVQRKNAKAKKYADGGDVNTPSDSEQDPYKQAGDALHKTTEDNDKYEQFKKNNPFTKKMASGGMIEKYAEGGEIKHDDDLMDELHESDRDFTENDYEEHMHDMPEHMMDEHHDVELEEEHEPSDAEIIHRILRKHKKM